ncbi:MAG TPA: hypothetical protein VE779_13690 [Candidatus Angelobacter sp.]|nr:hypothetical protein [Candidatus Angelobacter sp.]
MMRTALKLTILFAACASVFAQAPPAPPSSSAWPTSQFAAAAAKDPSVQKAKQILDNMIRALGGETYLTLRDMTVEGRTYAFYQGRPRGLGLLFWHFWQAPDKDRYELTKQRDVVDLYIADAGYETTYKGTVALDPKELSSYLRRRQHSLEWVVRNWLSAPGSMILYDGTAIVEQNLADKVTILTASNDSVTIAVDPRTHLPVRMSYSYRDPIDRQFDEDAELYSNYKVVQGINTPYSTVRMENGEMSNQRYINSVIYNTGLALSLFEPKGLLYNPPKGESAKPQ